MIIRCIVCNAVACERWKEPPACIFVDPTETMAADTPVETACRRNGKRKSGRAKRTSAGRSAGCVN